MSREPSSSSDTFRSCVWPARISGTTPSSGGACFGSWTSAIAGGVGLLLGHLGERHPGLHEHVVAGVVVPGASCRG